MITRSRLDLWRLGEHLGPTLLMLLAYDAAVTLVYMSGWKWVSIGELPLPLLGSAIAVIITFRNNAAYERWREARMLWGSVVNSSRSFARAMLTLTDDTERLVRLVKYQVAYALALRCSLLQLPPWEILSPYATPEALAELRQKANVPAAIHNIIGQEIAAARRSGSIDSISAVALDTTLSALANAQGGLERIKKTPLARQYSQFPRVFVVLYCLLLPVGLVNDLGYLTPVGSTVIGFMFLALDRIGRDLEDPFDNTIHDVPMQAITRTIEIDLLQATGAAEVPAPVKERDGVLW